MAFPYPRTLSCCLRPFGRFRLRSAATWRTPLPIRRRHSNRTTNDRWTRHARLRREISWMAWSTAWRKCCAKTAALALLPDDSILVTEDLNGTLLRIASSGVRQLRCPTTFLANLLRYDRDARGNTQERYPIRSVMKRFHFGQFYPGYLEQISQGIPLQRTKGGVSHNL
jgi:hypothetical protein